ncbi:hypothetical protein GCM10009809_06440 [Isoptericola hypogeus]|uniref:Uncharacterized protein n=1 Tax=Isoptericola hypogeus TaxID=300179 RepID=A0ABN2IWS0_9MICO
MDTRIEPFRPGDRISDDAELLELAAWLADASRPGERDLTLTWLDADDRVVGVVVPVDDAPAAPDVELTRHLGTLMREVLDEHAPGGSIVAVLGRPGDSAIGAADRAWNRALRADPGGRVRGVFVAADGVVRPLTLDDA